MKQHIPWRVNQTNPFNKDMFKGGQEKINDWDLNTKVYVYEPQSLADLGNNASELEYQKVWRKFQDGGHINIFLVPYREMPEFKAEITSVGASYEGLSKDEAIAGYTNVKMGDRPTKRFYSFTKLEESTEAIKDIEIFEENNLTEVINNDSTFKQTTFTLNKFEPYDGGEGSYYRDVQFYHGVFIPERYEIVNIQFEGASAIGGISLKDEKGSNIAKDLLLQKTGDFQYFGAINSSNNAIEYNQDNEMYPNFLVPTNTDTVINWGVPWTWEYMYLDEQFKELFIVGDGITNSKEAPNGINNFPQKTFTNTGVQYKHIFNEEFGGAAEQTNYFMPYIVEFGLPKGLSAHGSTFANDSEAESSEGLFNLQYTDNSLNGARAQSSIGTGAWYTESTILAVDYAYDEGVWIGGNMDLYLSKPTYGAFWQSDDYKSLLNEIIDGNPIYQGSVFTSEFGILEDIKTKENSEDLRKWTQSNDNIIGLLPWSVTELAKNYTNNPDYLDSKVIIGIKSPKDRTGIWDWSGGQSLRIVDGSYMYGKYIDNEKIERLETDTWRNRELTFRKSRLEDVGQFRINYNSFEAGKITIRLYYENLDTVGMKWSKTWNNEKAEGREMSGGTIITFL